MDIYHEAYCLRQGLFNFSFSCDIFGCPIWGGQIAITKALMLMIMFLFAVAITEATTVHLLHSQGPTFLALKKVLQRLGKSYFRIGSHSEVP